MADRLSMCGAALLAIIALLFGCDSDRAPTPTEVAPDLERVGPTRPRIIVLISLDTVRADHLSLYGYERFTSPRLDAFAAEGVVFEDMSATAPWTLPSHASILTGLYPIRHRITHYADHLGKDIATLPGLLEQGGYASAAVVNSSWLLQDLWNVTRDFQDFRHIPAVADRSNPSTLVTDQALEWIERAGDDRLFVLMHYFDAHSDYVSQERYEQLFVTPYDGIANGTSMFLSQSSLEDSYVEFCRERFDPEICKLGVSPEEVELEKVASRVDLNLLDIQHLQELYDAGIRQLDSEIGRFISELQRAGLLDETTVIITADHGEEFFEHGRNSHFLTQYQEVLRVPLIMRGPGVPSGRRIDTPVSSVDIMPTILGLAGVAVPRDLDGIDLRSLFDGSPDARFADRPIYGEASGGLGRRKSAVGVFPIYHSVRRGPYKLVHEWNSDTHALYDLGRDPLEQSDIKADHAERSAKMLGELRERYASHIPSGPDSASRGEAPADPGRVELDEAQIENLRSLGYIVPGP